MLQAQLELQPGGQTIALHTALAPGVYYLELKVEGRRLTRKFVVP